MRAMVLVPVLSIAAATPPPAVNGEHRPAPLPRASADRLAEAVGLAEAIELDVRDGIVVPVPRPRPATLVRQRQGRRTESADRRTRDRPRHRRSCHQPRSAAQPGACLGRQGHRPHRADPRNLRAARAHAGRPAPGRTRASQLPEEPARPLLDPSRAPARRRRLPRRPRRAPARTRPADAAGPHRRAEEGSRRRRAHALAPSRRPRQGAVSDRRHRRLHQCGEVDALQSHHRRRRARQGPGVRDARPDHARGRAAERPPHHPLRYRRVHLGPADVAGCSVPRDARRGRRRRSDPACSRHLASRYRRPGARRRRRAP